MDRTELDSALRRAGRKKNRSIYEQKRDGVQKLKRYLVGLCGIWSELTEEETRVRIRLAGLTDSDVQARSILAAIEGIPLLYDGWNAEKVVTVERVETSNGLTRYRTSVTRKNPDGE